MGQIGNHSAAVGGLAGNERVAMAAAATRHGSSPNGTAVPSLAAISDSQSKEYA
jgi:hypothetical protein